MAYTKQTWVNGETPLDADHLNHVEAGIASMADELALFVGRDLHSSGRLVGAEMIAGSSIHVGSTAEAIVHTGKNLYDVGAERSAYLRYDGFKAADPDTQILTIAVASGGSALAIRDTPIPVQAGDTFTMTIDCLNNDVNVSRPLLSLLDKDMNLLSSGLTGGAYVAAFDGFVGTKLGAPITFTITGEDVAFIRPGLNLRSGMGVADDTVLELHIQLEKGETATPWQGGKREILTPVAGVASCVALDGVNHVYDPLGGEVSVSWRTPEVVTSINGKKGNAVLTAGDVGALPADYAPPVTIVSRNADARPQVLAAVRRGHNESGVLDDSRRLGLMVMTDLHNDSRRTLNAIEYMDSTEEIDMGVCLGDVMPEHFSDNSAGWFTGAIIDAKKKLYPVLGNHDAGNTASTATSATKAQQFAKFFSPVLNKLSMPGLTTAYYSVETGRNVTLIMLDCHDLPDTLTDENTFAVSRKVVGYSQGQIDWLISTLAAVPSENHVLICVHNTLDAAESVPGAWTQAGKTLTDGEETLYDYPGLIPEIIDAWQRGASIQKSYAPAVNAQMPTLSVSANFTTRGPGAFAGYLRGHAHRDLIAKIAAYPSQNIFCLAATAHDGWQNARSDLPRIEGERCEDCVTVLSVDTIARLVKLVRIGSRVTFDLTQRECIAVGY